MVCDRKPRVKELFAVNNGLFFVIIPAALISSFPPTPVTMVSITDVPTMTIRGQGCSLLHTFHGVSYLFVCTKSQRSRCLSRLYSLIYKPFVLLPLVNLFSPRLIRSMLSSVTLQTSPR
jgi:hypothetical protein